MPRNISFALTIPQFKARTKTVTRRMGWLHAKPDDILMGVEKAQGIKAGEMVRLGLIKLVDVRREPLNLISADMAYGAREVIAEGFPEMSPEQFLEMFCDTHKGCESDSIITRLGYGYVD